MSAAGQSAAAQRFLRAVHPPAAAIPSVWRPQNGRGSLAAGAGRALTAMWAYLCRASGHPLLGKRQRRLRVSETVSLGEKRFVSILEVDGQAFLLGGSGSGVSLLATLSPAPAPESTPTFERVLRDSLQSGAR